MKKKMISVIKILGIVSDEVVIDMPIYDTVFNSIEWRRKGNQIILHKFIEDLDYEFNFDELPDDIKEELYLFLLKIALN